MLLLSTESTTPTKEKVPPRTLEQLEYYKLHYQQIYPQARLQAKRVLLKHLKKLSAEIRRIQGDSATSE